MPFAPGRGSPSKLNEFFVTQRPPPPPNPLVVALSGHAYLNLYAGPPVSFIFGHNTVLGGGGGSVGVIYANPVTCSSSGILQQLSTDLTGTGNVYLGLYDSDGGSGAPGTLLATTTSFVGVSGWNTVNVVTPVPVISGHNYYLAYISDTNSLLANTGTDLVYFDNTAFGALPNPFVNSGNFGGGLSIYAIAAQPGAITGAAAVAASGSLIATARGSLTLPGLIALFGRGALALRLKAASAGAAAVAGRTALITTIRGITSSAAFVALLGRGALALRLKAASAGSTSLSAAARLVSSARGPVSVAIYQQTLSGAGSSGYSTPAGYREYIPNSEFNPGVGTQISVTMFLASGSSGGNIVRAYIGSASGAGPNFTGDQAQLTWGGSAVLPSGNPGAYQSDFIPFNFTGQSLIFSTDFSGAGSPGVNVAETITGSNLETYWFSAPQTGDAASTTPSGITLGTQNQLFVSEIQVIPAVSMFAALSARLFATIRALAAPKGSLPASSRGALTMQAHVAPTGVSGLLARGQIETQVRASPTWKLSAAARAALSIVARGIPGSAGLISLVARSTVMLAGRFGPPSGAGTLFARAITAMSASSAFRGATSLTGRSATQTRSSGSGSFSLGLGAKAFISLASKAIATGKLAAAARASLAVMARVTYSSVGLVALLARGTLALSARITPKGAGTLFARSIMSVSARAASSVAIQVALAGRAIMMITRGAYSTSVGTVALLGRSILSFQSGLALPGSIQIIDGIATIVSNADTFIAAIGGRIRIAVRAVAAPGTLGTIALLARSITSLMARSQAGGKTPLSGTILNRTQAHASPYGAVLVAARAAMTAVSKVSSAVAAAISARAILAMQSRVAPIGKAAMAAKAAIATVIKAGLGTGGFVAFAGHTIMAIRAAGASVGQLSLNTAARLQVRGLSGISGRLNIAAQTILATAARSGVAGKVGAAGRAAVLLVSRAAVSGASALSGRVATLVRAQSGPTFALGLIGRAATTLRAQFGPAVGKLPIAARAAMTMVAKVTYGSVGAIGLMARGVLVVALRAAPIGKLTIAGASSRMATVGRTILGWSSPLAGRVAIELKSVAASTGSLSLASASRFALRARAAASGAAPVMGRSMLAAMAKGASVVAAGLSGASRLMARAQALPIGRVAIAARAAMTVAARLPYGFLGAPVALIGRAIFSLASRAGLPKLTLSLSASALASITGRAAPLGSLRIAARSMMRTSIRTTYSALTFVSLFAVMLLSTAGRVFGLTSLHGRRVARVEGRVEKMAHLDHDEDD